MLLTCAVVAALGMSACFKQKAFYTEGEEGTYVRAGALTYQVQLSRQLTPGSIEDREWLRGLPAGTAGPGPDETWFAVWMRVENTTETAATSTTDFQIEDSLGVVYTPLPLTATNPFRYQAERILPHETSPIPDSAASWDPTQGELLLFKLKLSTYQNRPLVLHIVSTQPPGPPRAEVMLDL